MAVNKHQNVSQPLQNRLKAASRVIATVNLRDENYVEHRVRGGGEKKRHLPPRFVAAEGKPSHCSD